MHTMSADLNNLAQPVTGNPKPPIRGGVITAYRTYKGKRLGPYYFRKWKHNGKVYKEYIKPIPSPADGQEMSRTDRLNAAVEKVRTACQEAKQKRKDIYRLLDNHIFQGKMLDRFDRGKEIRKDQADYIVRLHQEGMFIDGRPPYRAPRPCNRVLDWMLKNCTTAQVADWLLAQLSPSHARQTTNDSQQSTNFRQQPFGAPSFSYSSNGEVPSFEDWFSALGHRQTTNDSQQSTNYNQQPFGAPTSSKFDC